MSEYAHLDNKVKNLHRHTTINTEQLKLLNSKVHHISTSGNSKKNTVKNGGEEKKKPE